MRIYVEFYGHRVTLTFIVEVWRLILERRLVKSNALPNVWCIHALVNQTYTRTSLLLFLRRPFWFVLFLVTCSRCILPFSVVSQFPPSSFSPSSSPSAVNMSLSTWITALHKWTLNTTYPAMRRLWPRSLTRNEHWWRWRWPRVHDRTRMRTPSRGWTSRTARHRHTDVRSPRRSVMWSQTARCSWRPSCPAPCWKTATNESWLPSQGRKGDSWQRLQSGTARSPWLCYIYCT